ncbi:MAG TPA: arsenosugar biosynthesis radical SAM (seleno)protein ArsS [Xanthomonadaceae bacterium]|nr:arsenosugar biosynthesis radical SAM (seleno)protein ArsS [Xanthomonadaceae bacterium]
MRETWPLLRGGRFPAIERDRLTVLQLNLGYLCNLSCIHCHVNAGPRRTELMSRDTMDLALQVAERHGIHRFDLTGGSPEMNPHFRWLVRQAVDRGIAVMDRLNPTIIEEPGYEWVAPFLAGHAVETIASLPCYSAENVDAQRGEGVFEASIRALRKLNALGYGQPHSGLVLNLVYNPNGAFLPPPQAELEADYRRLLGERFGIVFNELFALANMPIKRFGSWLVSKGLFDDYMATLEAAHRDENLASVMCRSLLSVDWQGYVYDCDFNQMLGLAAGAQAPGIHLRDLLVHPVPRRIAVGRHCFGCTAGQGSSCGGALDPSGRSADSETPEPEPAIRASEELAS